MNRLSETASLKSLGSSTDYRYEGADRRILERFPNPLEKGPGVGEVKIVSPEFTSLCPMTGQPDFATIVVEYIPRAFCVESKAWKLYLGSYRQVGEFHESCIRRIANDLIHLLDPWVLRVRGEFTPRGGIPFWPEVKYERPDAILLTGADGEISDEAVAALSEQTDEFLVVDENGYAVAYAYTGDESDEMEIVRLDTDYSLGDASEIH